MELRHVHAFLALAEELHFGRAAARLHVVQSSLSQTLKALEQEVGACLVARTRRRVELTPAGEQFREHALHALNSLDTAATLARAADEGTVGHLTLRLALLSALTPLPQVLARFRRERPAVAVSIRQGGSSSNLEELAAGRCDLALVTYRRKAPPFACEVVTDEPLVALLPKRHRLAARDRVSFADLVHEPRIVLSQHAEPELHAKYYRAHSTNPGVDVVVEADQIDTILAFVAAGVGVAHAPGSVRQLKPKGVVAVPFHPIVSSGTSVVWNPEQLSPVARQFLEALLAARQSSLGSRSR